MCGALLAMVVVGHCGTDVGYWWGVVERMLSIGGSVTGDITVALLQAVAPLICLSTAVLVQAVAPLTCLSTAVLVQAEALYSMGEFERGLVLYERGARTRPDMPAFRRGGHKCREAILNAIGGRRCRRCLGSKRLCSTLSEVGGAGGA